MKKLLTLAVASLLACVLLTGCTSVTGISLPATLEVERGQPVELAVTYAYQNENASAEDKAAAAEKLGLTWASNGPAVVVAEDGTLTAAEGGTATVTASSADGKLTASCTVTVTVPVTGVEAPPELALTLNVTESAALGAKVLPADASDTALTYTSSDETVAVVAADGTVTAVGPGKAIITTASSKGKTAVTKVSVAIKFLPSKNNFIVFSLHQHTGQWDILKCEECSPLFSSNELRCAKLGYTQMPNEFVPQLWLFPLAQNSGFRITDWVGCQNGEGDDEVNALGCIYGKRCTSEKCCPDHANHTHRGLDISAGKGTNVLAAKEGEVLLCASLGSRGNTIVLKHSGEFSGYYTVYEHLDSFAENIKVGRSVESGEVIGKVGNSGTSKVHLHFEIRWSNETITDKNIGSKLNTICVVNANPAYGEIVPYEGQEAGYLCGEDEGFRDLKTNSKNLERHAGNIWYYFKEDEIDEYHKVNERIAEVQQNYLNLLESGKELS